jgi:hypothetical protein
MENIQDEHVKQGQFSCTVLYIFSLVGLVSGVILSIYHLLYTSFYAFIFTILISIGSWASINAFLYLITIIEEINDNTSYLKK